MPVRTYIVIIIFYATSVPPVSRVPQVPPVSQVFQVPQVPQVPCICISQSPSSIVSSFFLFFSAFYHIFILRHLLHQASNNRTLRLAGP